MLDLKSTIPEMDSDGTSTGCPSLGGVCEDLTKQLQGPVLVIYF